MVFPKSAIYLIFAMFFGILTKLEVMHHGAGPFAMFLTFVVLAYTGLSIYHAFKERKRAS